MKRLKLILFFICTLIFSSSLVKANQDIDYQSLNLLPFNGSKQIVLGEFDHLGRATSAHIQLQDKDEPKKRREPRIKYNPVGWHNYKISYGNQGKNHGYSTGGILLVINLGTYG